MKAVQDAADKPKDEPPGVDLTMPTPAWAILADPARFPRRVAFLDEESFQTCSYRTGYEEAKRLLETQAGITRPTRRNGTPPPAR
jgi:hypothetical protein